jgi:LysM repeat protein
MIYIKIYNAQQRKREYLETDLLETLLNQLDLLPDYSGNTIEFERRESKIKFQVSYDQYYRITFFIKEKDKSVLEKREYARKCICLFFENEEQYQALFNDPLEYFKKNNSAENHTSNSMEEEEEYTIYRVEADEKLKDIARKCRTTIEDIKKANPKMRTFFNILGTTEFAGCMQDLRISSGQAIKQNTAERQK